LPCRDELNSRLHKVLHPQQVTSMHIFLWFGWSVIWSIFCFFPLLRRLIGAMSGGTPARQRQGSIRLLLGALGAICASSGLSAMFGSDGVGSVDAGTGISAAAAGVYQSNTFGHALSDALTGIFGSWIATLVLLLLAAASLRWLFRLGRAGRSSTDDVSAAVLVTRDMPRGKPRDKPRDSSRFEGMPATPAMPSVSNTVGARISERKMQRDHVVATRRAAPWKLPSAPISGAATGSTAGAKPSTAPVQPQPSPKTTSHRAPWSIAPPPPAPAARNESQWAPFESLRPTPAMMARSRTLASRESAVERMPGSTRSTTSALASTLVSTSITATNPVSRPSARDGLLTARASQGPLPATLPAAFPRIAPSAAANSAPNAAPGNARPALDFEAPLQAEARPIAPLTTAAAATAAVIAPTSTNWPWRTDSPAAATTSPHGADIMQTAAPQSPPVSAPASATSIMPMPTTAPASPFYTRTFDAPTAPAPSIPTYDEPDIILPALALLDAGGDERIDIPAAQLEETGRLIEQRLKEFKVPVTVLGAYSGPVITRYEVEPALGVRGAQIVNLMKDLSRALGLTSIRVVETIPGKTCMGLELPNSKRQMIRLAEIFESDAYRQSDSKLTLAMGKDITGLPVVTDLARAPHMLVAGTTGSGKSVAING
jgi:S-DNA-T family DNA segregation ATPase FtsK/SpoIIIE